MSYGDDQRDPRDLETATGGPFYAGWIDVPDRFVSELALEPGETEAGFDG